MQIAIVGGGIIGTAIAVALVREGQDVTIIEPDELGTGAAAGSAGYVSLGEIFPLANPGVVWDMPRMLSDPVGALVIDPRYFFRLIPWGLRFLAATRRSQRERGVDALANLNRNAAADLFELANAAGASSYLSADGGLLVCREERSLVKQIAQLPVLHDRGIRAEVRSANDVRDMEPALRSEIAGAIFFPDSARCSDPRAFGIALGAFAQTQGATWLRSHVRGMHQQPDGTWRLDLDDATLAASHVVVAAGVWSGETMKSLGYRCPIETERGYHLMLPQPEIPLHRPMVFEEAHFCATPMDAGVRLAGTVEFAGTKAPMHPKRSDVLYGLATRYLAGLRPGEERWMGFRPSFPDSLPAIGRAALHKNLFYCFGHQHLGLTQAATSAKYVVDMIAERKPMIDLAPFDLKRFA